MYLCNLLIKLEEKVAREVVLRKPVGKRAARLRISPPSGRCDSV
jgi:hypothetical protein